MTEQMSSLGVLCSWRNGEAVSFVRRVGCKRRSSCTSLRSLASRALTHPGSVFQFPDRAGSMARVTVEDCLEKEENRFALVVLAARRTRQLMKGQDALVRSTNKFAVTSLREIASGKVHFHRDTDEVVKEWLKETNPQGL